MIMFHLIDGQNGLPEVQKTAKQVCDETKNETL